MPASIPSAVSPLTSPPVAVIQQAAQRMMRRCEELASCTERPGEITRTFCSPAMRQVHAKMRGWMEAAGMTCRLDPAANLIGRFEGRSTPLDNDSTRTMRTLLVGSHLDTVVNGGKYDGTLGVLMGLALAELLRGSDTHLSFALDVIGFGEEEGVRYQTPYIGSRALVGDLPDELLNRCDADGIPLCEALQAFGGDPGRLADAVYRPEQIVAYLETHIEQGPVLEREGLPVGIVTGFAGQTRASLQFIGRAGHAGTTPMNARQDALAAAAQFVLEVEQIARCEPGLVATVAQLNVSPNVGNVIPGAVQLRIDLRHLDDAVREAAFQAMLDRAGAMADSRYVRMQFLWVQHQSATQCDAGLTSLLEQAVADTGIRPLRMASGAGHDAVVMAPRFPTAMLFVRCAGGVSHHPDESVSENDVATALEVLWRFVAKLATTEGSWK